MTTTGEDVLSIRWNTRINGGTGLAHVAMTYKTPDQGMWRHGGDLLVPPAVAEALHRAMADAGRDLTTEETK